MNVRTIISLLYLADAAIAQEQPPEFVLQNGHSSAVYTVAFSPDGKTLASGSEDNTIKLWEIASGKLLRTLEANSRTCAVAFSPDGKTLASGGSDHTIKLWEMASSKLLRALEGHSNNVRAVAFSPDGTILASADGDPYNSSTNASWDEKYSIKLWEMTSGRLLRTLEGHSYEGLSCDVYAVAFSPDSKTLASGSGDHTIKLWEMASGKLLRTLEGHSSTIYAVAFSPDGKTLASGTGLFRVETPTPSSCGRRLRANCFVPSKAILQNGLSMMSMP